MTGQRGARSRKPSPASRIASTRLLALAILALLGIAVLAPVGLASEGEGAHAQAQALHASQMAAERASARMVREAERTAKVESRKAAGEVARQARKEREHAIVKTDCSGITVTYRGFPDVTGNTILENIKIAGVRFPMKTYVFNGPEAVQTIPVIAPVGHYLIDIHAKWRMEELKGGFDIPGAVSCSPKPAFTLEKTQAIAGSGLPFTSATLSGHVGQTIDYRLLATNTGNTPLTFGTLTDKLCDPGTIKGGESNPVEPLGTVEFICSHTLTAADEAAGSYMNVATLTGTPEEGEGSPVTEPSNPVEVDPVTAEEVPTTPTTPAPTPKQEVLSNTTSSNGSSGGGSPQSGVLAFSSASVPALHGPQGCVRGAFTASIRSAGVNTVIFYLDGHKLKRLTYHNAHNGLLSVRIDGSKLKIGAHKVMAKITMKQSSPTATAAKASRALMIVRCKSAVLTPRFTG
jgi:uncharacterized repeat protein (TIGR01451 family)